ncbi:MAG: DNA topoisomerase-1 [Halopseudomonas sp.]
MDREGEAIAWHLRESIGGDEGRYKRVVFNEITKKAIQEAFAKPGELDLNRVNAQQARRFLDRVVGYMVSPLLWQKIARGLSAGRVQSVAVKLIVDREREIRAFIPEEFWEVHALLNTPQSQSMRFEVAKQNGETFRPINKAQTDKALALLKDADYSVTKREDKPTSSKPNAPFITSTLQQAASTRLGFGVKKTMMMAQRLYEAGYITYMRTDSTNLSADAIGMARGYIEKNFGAKYLPEKPNVYSSKDGAQEAHEAIRPSDVKLKTGDLKGMEKDAERLYELIWRQFLACQMTPAQYLSTLITVTAGDFELRAKGRILKFDGYTKVMPQQGKGGEDEVLPDVKVKDVMALEKLDPKQHFTKPPARYSEASLVKELEKRGIGRPSTYASIISTIQDRGYVSQNNRRFYAEKMGDIVTERLAESFPNLMDYSFTATMEESLDEVAQGGVIWKKVLDDFYKDFSLKLSVAETAEDGKGMRANEPTLTDIACKECGRPMMIRTASTGVFLGCSGYALPPKERCKSTVNLVPGNEVAADDDEGESRVLRNKRRCPICSTAMDSYLVDEKRKLHVCGNNPDCNGFEIEEGQFKIKGYDGPIIECDKCGSEMQLKTGRFGKYFGCTNSECKNTRKLLKSGEAAPPKMDPVKMPELKCEKVDDVYVLRDGASGMFLAASQFPKNRETRAPLVKELLPHREEIDPKYHFLLDAPAKDPDGLPTVIRYSRKTKEQYVQSEVEGKPSGWRAFYDGKRWTADDGRPKAKAKAKG